MRGLLLVMLLLINKVSRCMVRCVELKCILIGFVEGAWIVYVEVHKGINVESVMRGGGVSLVILVSIG